LARVALNCDLKHRRRWSCCSTRSCTRSRPGGAIPPGHPTLANSALLMAPPVVMLPASRVGSG
jgi:hypothetical protein